MTISDTTPAVQRALEAAEAIAARRGAAVVAPRDLLAGLLAEPEGRAAVLLARYGCDTSRWLSGADPNPAALDSAERLPSAEATRAIRRARELARESTEDRICTTDNLLLGILQTDDALRAELQRLELNCEELERELRAGQAHPLELDEPLNWSDAGAPFEMARILDANANRAREALRVLEDFCRFILNDAFLSRELKEIRHSLADALAALPKALLIAARDTGGDVGTAIGTERERERSSTREVVAANAKRLQEALRTLEEFGKLYGAEFGTRLEAVRYRAYTVERLLLHGHDARAQLAEARLYVLLSGATCQAALDWTIAEAAAGGADVVQLREKTLTDRDLLHRARDVRRWTRAAKVLFIMNDRPDIARLADGDGVHLGQDDMPVREARRILGSEALIGVSTHTLEQVQQAVRDGASYIGVGPTFASTTKHFDALAGLDFVRAATAETTLPAFVLGGVTTKNVGHVVAAGGLRVAVSAAIAQADDPRAVAATLKRALTAIRSPTR